MSKWTRAKSTISSQHLTRIIKQSYPMPGWILFHFSYFCKHGKVIPSTNRFSLTQCEDSTLKTAQIMLLMKYALRIISTKCFIYMKIPLKCTQCMSNIPVTQSNLLKPHYYWNKQWCTKRHYSEKNGVYLPHFSFCPRNGFQDGVSPCL